MLTFLLAMSTFLQAATHTHDANCYNGTVHTHSSYGGSCYTAVYDDYICGYYTDAVYTDCPTCLGAGEIGCSTCGGSGSLVVSNGATCSTCGGSGSVTVSNGTTCSSCKGSGSVTVSNGTTCSSCNGSGEVNCSSCGGEYLIAEVCTNCRTRMTRDEYVANNYFCTWCHEGDTTSVYCNSCNFGKTSCSGCGGDGKVSSSKSCSACGGDGRTDSSTGCSICGGDGRVDSSINCSVCDGDGSYSCQASGCSGGSVLDYYECTGCSDTSNSYGGTHWDTEFTGYELNCGKTAGHYYSGSTDVTSTPQCSTMIKSIAATKSSQTLSTASDFDSTVLITFYDGSTKTVTANNNFSTMKTDYSNSLITLTYSGKYNAVGNTKSFTCTTRVTSDYYRTISLTDYIKDTSTVIGTQTGKSYLYGSTAKGSDWGTVSPYDDVQYTYTYTDCTSLLVSQDAEVCRYWTRTVNKYNVTVEDYIENSTVKIGTQAAKQYEYGSAAKGSDWGTASLYDNAQYTYIYVDCTSTTVNGVTTVKRYWKRTVNKYSVTQTDGVSGVSSSLEYDYGTTVTVNAGTKAGYDFVKWNVLNGTVNMVDITSAITSFTIVGNCSLKAEWTPMVYEIIYNLDKGTVSGNPISYNLTTATFTLKNPTRTGYTFTGWTGSLSGMTVTVEKGSMGDLNFTANWIPNQNTKYVVNYWQQKINGSETDYSQTGYTLYESKNYTGESDSTLTIADYIKEYVGFTYLLTQANRSTVTTATTILPDGSRVIDIYYKRNSYSITLNDTATGASGIGTYMYGDTVTINAGVKTGYTFDYWEVVSGIAVCDDENSVETEFVLEDNDVVLKAHWTINKYAVTLVNVGADATGSGEYDYNSSITINAGTIPGKLFVSWSTSDVALNNTFSINTGFTLPDRDVEVTANWLTVTHITANLNSNFSNKYNTEEYYNGTVYNVDKEITVTKNMIDVTFYYDNGTYYTTTDYYIKNGSSVCLAGTNIITVSSEIYGKEFTTEIILYGASKKLENLMSELGVSSYDELLIFVNQKIKDYEDLEKKVYKTISEINDTTKPYGVKAENGSNVYEALDNLVGSVDVFEEKYSDEKNAHEKLISDMFTYLNTINPILENTETDFEITTDLRESMENLIASITELNDSYSDEKNAHEKLISDMFTYLNTINPILENTETDFKIRHF